MTLAVATASAEGYQSNSQSARQTGMGHTGVAMNLGAESMHFNPAGMAALKSDVEVSLGATAIFSKVELEDCNIDGKNYSTDNPVSTPVFAYAAFRVWKDKLTAGVSLTNPYGSALDWGNKWPGAMLIEDISLRSFVVQPTVAFKVLPNLSLGGGLMVSMGNFDLNRATMPAGIFSGAGIDEAPAWLNINGKANIAYGYNVGLLWNFAKKWNFGVSYRSEMKMKVDNGDMEIKYIDAMATIAPSAKALFDDANALYDEIDISTELPMPANLTVGFAFQPNKCLTLELDAQFVGWEAYKDLDFTATVDGESVPISQTYKNYRNTVIVRAGAQYLLGSKWTVRAGAYFDETPVRSKYFYPDGPGFNKLGMSGGASWMPAKWISVDLAATYIQGFSREASCPNGTADTFGGDYKCRSFLTSLGVNMLF